MLFEKEKDRPAQVWLYSKDVYFEVPKLLMASPMAILRVGDILAHEVGHHVIATRGYIYKPWEKYKPWDGVRNPVEEKMADAYSLDVLKRMTSRWHYALALRLTKGLATRLYKAGLEDYWRGDYRSSAQLQFKAYTFNPDNEDAGQCYRHAMEKLRTQDPSPLTETEREWLSTRYNPMPSKKTRIVSAGGTYAKRRHKKHAGR